MGLLRLPKAISATASAEIKCSCTNNIKKYRHSLVVPYIHVNDRNEMIGAPADSVGLLTFFRDDNNNEEMIEDYSGEIATEFVAAPAADEIWYVNLLTVYLMDANIRYDYFGGLGNVLENGIGFYLKAGDPKQIILDIFDGVLVKATGDFAKHSGVFSAQPDSTTLGKDVVAATITLREINGESFKLDGSLNMSLHVVLNDDLVGLDSFTWKITGQKVNRNYINVEE